MDVEMLVVVERLLLVVLAVEAMVLLVVLLLPLLVVLGSVEVVRVVLVTATICSGARGSVDVIARLGLSRREVLRA